MKISKLAIGALVGFALVSGCKKDKPAEAPKPTTPQTPNTATAGTTGPAAANGPTGTTGPAAAAGCNSDLAQPLAGDTTFTEKCSPYTVSADLSVRELTLTLEPGVELKFKDGTSFDIGYGGKARLVARGTPEKPVRFTSLSRKEPAAWKGLHLYDGAAGSSLENVVVEYGGDLTNAALLVEAEDVTVKGLKLVEVKKAGLLVHGTLPVRELSGLDLSKAGGDPDELVAIEARDLGALGAGNTFPEKAVIGVSGNIDHDTRISKQGVPYRVLGEISVDAAEGKTATVTIEAGTTLQMAETGGFNFGYSGTAGLKIQGTAEKPVTFTRYGDDAKTTPWKGIAFYEKSRAPEIAFAVFEHAAKEGQAALRYLGPNGLGSLNSTTFRHLTGTAVQIDAAKERFVACDGNTFTDVTGAAFDAPLELAQGIGSGNVLGKDGYAQLHGRAARDTTLKPLNGPWRVEGELNVDSDDGARSATLTLEPGTTLAFNDQGKLNIGYANPAKLVARGTPEKPVTFTGTADAWRGISVFAHGTVDAENVTIDKVAEDTFGLDLDKDSKGSAKAITFKATKQGVHKCALKFALAAVKVDADGKAEIPCE